MKNILLPFSWLYGLGAAARNAAYDRGWFKTMDAGVPVISIGNLTAGGTGKTPLVEFVVRYLSGKGLRPAIISRGYRRRSSGVVVVSDGVSVRVDAGMGGDEPVQMAEKFKAVPVIVAERRIDAARVAVQDFHADVLVLDDGFQHRSLKRDLDLLVVDARKDLIREPMLPAGLRRESFEAIGRAGVLVLSKLEGALPPPWVSSLSQWFRRPLVLSRPRTASIHRLPGHDEILPAEIRTGPVLAFSGIADHQGFLKSLRELEIPVADSVRFSDHHPYAAPDIRRLVARARALGASAFVTTEKDMVRIAAQPGLQDQLLEGGPVLYTRIEVEILEGLATLTEAIDHCVEGRGA